MVVVGGGAMATTVGGTLFVCEPGDSALVVTAPTGPVLEGSPPAPPSLLLLFGLDSLFDDELLVFESELLLVELLDEELLDGDAGLFGACTAGMLTTI